MKTGLFFGSFNPVHIGHLAIANYMVEFTDIDRLWFVISPHNPLKKKESLLPDYARYELLKMAIANEETFDISDIEFRLPKPSYTIDTLTYLRELYPRHHFVLIIGSDNLSTFSKWKNYRLIEENYHRYVYPRKGSELIDLKQHKNITIVNAPVIEISSSFIRKSLAGGKNIRYFLPGKVYEEIIKMNYFK
ncbi:MAG: nicotinate (nicotinamide) nucleotide adenylyltransferase [Bacteroidales bacterium]